MRRALLPALGAEIALFLGLVVGLTANAATAATPAKASVQVIFQHPPAYDPHGDNEAIAHELTSLFARVTRGWNVYISMFDLLDNGAQRNDVVDRLLTTIATSGATVHVVVDDHQAPSARPKLAMPVNCAGPMTGTDKAGRWTRAAARLWCIATRDGKYPARFKACHLGCLGDKHDGWGIDHDKFVLFRGPSGQRIVASASANWTQPQLTNKFQTMTVVTGHAALFNSWLAYWEALKANTARPDYGGRHSANSHDLDVHFYPSATDPILDSLQAVRCALGGTIRIAVNSFDEERYADQLRAMRRAGCTIRVVLITGADTSVLKGVPHRCIDGMHSKDVIIDGRLSTGRRSQAVWTGSRPMSGGPKSSDNADLRLPGSSWVHRFERNFDPIFRAARRC